MIITSAPLRVSFFGGGSDYPDHYLRFGGKVLSTTIDARVYVSLQKTTSFSKSKYIISYSQREMVDEIKQIEHPAVRAILDFFNISDGLEITIFSDLPAKTGLGSSSSFTVALLAACYRYLGIEKTNYDIGVKAIEVEQQLIADKVGSQDQMAAAMGGFNEIRFSTNGNIQVNPIALEEQQIKALERNFFMVFTQRQRFANDIAAEQLTNIKSGNISLQTQSLVKLVDAGKQLLLSGDERGFAQLLDQAWRIKRNLASSISDSELDRMYASAMTAGALGGKLLGAGGGGFFLFYAEQEARTKIIETFGRDSLLPFKMSKTGLAHHDN